MTYRINILVVLCTVLSTFKGVPVQAVEGTNAKDVKMTVEMRQGGEWFDVRRFRADENGVIEIENVLPGKYRIAIDNKYQMKDRTIAARLMMTDEDGIELDEKSDVDVYAQIGDQEVFAGTFRTDREGELELESLN